MQARHAADDEVFGQETERLAHAKTIDRRTAFFEIASGEDRRHARRVETAADALLADALRNGDDQIAPGEQSRAQRLNPSSLSLKPRPLAVPGVNRGNPRAASQP